MDIKREKQLRSLTKSQVICHLESELDSSEYILKEVWEECDGQEEFEVVEDEMKKMIELLESM